MIYKSDCPKSLPCWTCKHRKTEEYGPSIFVGITEQQCTKFGRTDRFGNNTPLTCAGAYEKFCGGGDWEPTFIHKIKLWVKRLFALTPPANHTKTDTAQHKEAKP